jgi:tRNA-Thr(GGU) m(6)t(6)A37 methyltransferase TsaA
VVAFLLSNRNRPEECTVEDKPVVYHPIGTIHSPHTVPEQTPVQPVFAQGIRGTVEVLPDYTEGLDDLEAFSHIYLVFHMHRSPGVRMKVTPYLDEEPRGLFATRGPWRPNPIGFSVVRLLKREDNVLTVQDVDVLDGTPLLDIKPYVARFDERPDAKSGWQDEVDDNTAGRRGLRDYEPGPPPDNQQEDAQ